MGPCSPGFPGGQIQGAGVEPTSLGPLRHYKDKNWNKQTWKSTYGCAYICTDVYVYEYMFMWNDEDNLHLLSNFI